MNDHTQHKALLEAERAELEKALGALGKRDPENPENWDVKVPEIDVMNADENEAADRTEELHIDSIVLDELENRYRTVLHGLARLEEGAYGVCEVCGNPIEEERLAANAAARTCKADMGKEEGLAI